MFEFKKNYVADLSSLNLPELLTCLDGTKILDSETWVSKRRPEILRLFKNNVFGHSPTEGFSLDFKIVEQDDSALKGTAIRKQVEIKITNSKGLYKYLDVLIYLPLVATTKPVPVFTTINFSGNHTVQNDADIFLPRKYSRNLHNPPEDYRGEKASSYPVDSIIGRGFGFMTVYSEDIDTDEDNDFKNGVHSLFENFQVDSNNSWGTIAGWSWGLSRLLDYAKTDSHIDSSKVIVLGHSRMGKAALWAAAQDTRFAMAIANNSGCTGASLTRHKKGETVYKINTRFPHWFCKKYKYYNRRRTKLLVDQHMLLALIAPRPIYISSATRDDWADQEGEFLSCLAAKPVYDLFDLKTSISGFTPQTDIPICDGYIGYHIKTGRHSLTEFDWKQYILFANQHFLIDSSSPQPK